MPFSPFFHCFLAFQFISPIFGQQISLSTFLPQTLSPSAAERILPFGPENSLDKSIDPSNIGTKGNGQKNRPPQIFSTPLERFTTKRAILRLKFKRYANFERKMKNLTTCACDGRNCAQDGKSNRNPCYFSFTAIATAADQVVDFRFTPFVVVENGGIIDGNKEPEWGAEMEFGLPAKPQFVEIYAFNLGPVFSSFDGHVVSWAETVWPVDAWTLDLGDLAPQSWMETTKPVQREMAGRFVESSLNLEYSVQCQNEFMGRKCDLKCRKGENGVDLHSTKLYGGANRISSESAGGRPQMGQNTMDKTICESDLEQKIFFECQFADNRRQQVDRCQFCQFGVINKSICVRDPALWKDQPGDNELFRVATIILAALLAILFLILVVTCIFCWIFCRRNSSSKIGRESADLGTYRRGIGAPYNISENGFGSTRDPPLPPPIQTADWAKPPQPPLAVRGILVHPHSPHSPHPPVASSSPNTSESDFRPSPFTPRREAQV